MWQVPFSISSNSVKSNYTCLQDEVHAKKAAGKNVQPTPGAKRLPAEQLNNLLKMYPQKVDL